MSDRQNDIEQSEAMKRASGVSGPEALLESLSEVIYSMPIYQTPDARDKLIAEFGNSIQMACYEGKRTKSKSSCLMP